MGRSRTRWDRDALGRPAVSTSCPPRSSSTFRVSHFYVPGPVVGRSECAGIAVPPPSSPPPAQLSASLQVLELDTRGSSSSSISSTCGEMAVVQQQQQQQLLPHAEGEAAPPSMVLRLLADPSNAWATELHHGCTGHLLWPAARTLACSLDAVVGLAGGSLLSDARVVELGAGLGAVGMAAAMRGAQVVLTDACSMLPLLRHNCYANKQNFPRGPPCVAELNWTTCGE
jgi:hypothetical protein